MSTQIQFKTGRPIRFIATRSFGLGASNLSITKGMELDFDGTYVTADGHAPLSVPSLRGAVRQGWIVPEESYDPEDMSSSIPRSAGISMRAADGGNPMDTHKPRVAVTTVDAEEQEVGSVARHAQSTRDRNATPRGQRMSATTLAEEQDGVVVRGISTPAKQYVDLEKESADSAIRRANSAKIQPGVGRTREDVVADMSEEDREEYLADVSARKNAYAEGDNPEALRERAANERILARRAGNSGNGQVVGRVAASKNHQKEGFNITNTVGNGIETFDASVKTGENVVTTGESEGIKFTTTNGPKKAVAPARKAPSVQAQVVGTVGNLDPRRRIAKAICADFPDNYVFEDSTKKKLARLQADYEDRFDVIRAVAASETDADFRNRLVEEFPEAFA